MHTQPMQQRDGHKPLICAARLWQTYRENTVVCLLKATWARSSPTPPVGPNTTHMMLTSEFRCHRPCTRSWPMFAFLRLLTPSRGRLRRKIEHQRFLRHSMGVCNWRRAAVRMLTCCSVGQHACQFSDSNAQRGAPVTYTHFSDQQGLKGFQADAACLSCRASRSECGRSTANHTGTSETESTHQCFGYRAAV